MAKTLEDILSKVPFTPSEIFLNVENGISKTLNPVRDINVLCNYLNYVVGMHSEFPDFGRVVVYCLDIVKVNDGSYQPAPIKIEDNPDDLISVIEAARISGLAVQTIRNRINKGILPYKKVTGQRHRYLVRREDAENLE